MGKRRLHRPADYLSFPTDYPEHIKIRPFIREFGDEGLTFCTRMVCFLATQRGWEYPYTEQSIKDLSEYYEYDYPEFHRYLTFAIEKNFFQKIVIEDKKYIRCEFMEEVLLERLVAKREQKREYQAKRRASKSVEKEEDGGPAGPIK